MDENLLLSQLTETEKQSKRRNWTALEMSKLFF